MSELMYGFDGPPKYLNQRDAPLEIPVEVVRKLFNAMDVDLDDAINLEELKAYITSLGRFLQVNRSAAFKNIFMKYM